MTARIFACSLLFATLSCASSVSVYTLDACKETCGAAGVQSLTSGGCGGSCICNPPREESSDG